MNKLAVALPGKACTCISIWLIKALLLLRCRFPYTFPCKTGIHHCTPPYLRWGHKLESTLPSAALILIWLFWRRFFPIYSHINFWSQIVVPPYFRRSQFEQTICTTWGCLHIDINNHDSVALEKIFKDLSYISACKMLISYSSLHENYVFCIRWILFLDSIIIFYYTYTCSVQSQPGNKWPIPRPWIPHIIQVYK